VLHRQVRQTHLIGQRSSPRHLAGDRNAAHPVKAILNYAYAALESEIRIKAISEGYDPTIGVMHEGSDGSSKFMFDLMEPERPKVEPAVLDFVKGHIFDPADFVIRTDGVCRLNPGGDGFDMESLQAGRPESILSSHSGLASQSVSVHPSAMNYN
jgi:hypothetical protein